MMQTLFTKCISPLIVKKTKFTIIEVCQMSFFLLIQNTAEKRREAISKVLSIYIQ